MVWGAARNVARNNVCSQHATSVEPETNPSPLQSTLKPRWVLGTGLSRAPCHLQQFTYAVRRLTFCIAEIVRILRKSCGYADTHYCEIVLIWTYASTGSCL